MKTEQITFEQGSGNVFADLGLPDADERHAKMRMIVTISCTLKVRAPARKEAAKVLATTQKNVVLIHRFEIDDFSVEQLMQFANALEYEVVIQLRPRAQPEHAARGVDMHAAAMLTSTQEIFETAQSLAKQLEESYNDLRGREWTSHIFGELRKFCQTRLRLEATDCFHRNHPEGKNEFLWDFIAVSPGRGILLAAESEQATHNAGAKCGLRHDFEKLLYVYAPIRILICKAKSKAQAESLMNELKEYAHDCCRSFNPGSAFLLHFRLWLDDSPTDHSLSYIWQSRGDPSDVREEEVLNFILV